MRNSMIVGIVMTGLATSSSLFGQNNADDIAQLKERVTQLEKQVLELSRIIEPLKVQQAAEGRRKALREKFDNKMAQDRSKYSPEQLREAEKLYQVANQKWGSPEAKESLQTMVQNYPDINRTGCAVLYIAQKSEGAARAKYLQECIEKFNNCFYGDGVQVGAYARFLLAQDYKVQGQNEKADALFAELKSDYSDAVDHSGRLLADAIKPDSK